MKIILILLLSGSAVLAQTQSAEEKAFRARYAGGSAAPAPTPAVNRGQAPAAISAADQPVFRVVNGQPYNTQKSVLWKHFEAECKGVLTNGIKLEEVKYQRIYARESTSTDLGGNFLGSTGMSDNRRLVSQTRIPGKIFFVRNYPASLSPTDGKTIRGLAIQVGTIQIDGQTIELWDYGTPYVPTAATAP